MINYKSVFDIIGPIMIGPSSSHTAGAVALGHAARQVFHGQVTSVVIHYYESFAETHKGHGTDYAIIAGILGLSPSNPDVPIALELAKKQAITIKFIEEKVPSPIGHPNTAIIHLMNLSHQITLAGCSIGGGTIQIREIQMDGFTIKPTGPLPLLLVQQVSDQVKLTVRLEKLSHINQQKSYHSVKGDLFEYELDTPLRATDLTALTADYQQLVYL
ncbi:serine dehydratase beta chain [Loigolactobacillus zhaoyuanensis]|uniref:serine dehydratase beta chain n=1 Tax=Loigolactobacillus zhaoyuanensis TaxID=2486017 RepID=UPI001CDBC4D9|nr:serine dehydratase beta chain [Loigolactobacillus zhaoyuanensis]